MRYAWLHGRRHGSVDLKKPCFACGHITRRRVRALPALMQSLQRTPIGPAEQPYLIAAHACCSADRRACKSREHAAQVLRRAARSALLRSSIARFLGLLRQRTRCTGTSGSRCGHTWTPAECGQAAVQRSRHDSRAQAMMQHLLCNPVTGDNHSPRASLLNSHDRTCELDAGLHDGTPSGRWLWQTSLH